MTTIKEILWEGLDWIHLAQNTANGGFCGHGNEISDFVQFLELRT
jgi:hypothetical protein